MTIPATASSPKDDPQTEANPASSADDAYLRTEFLQRLAHDLRGPAGVIHGALQELELALGTNAGAHATFLGMAKRGLRRILHTADRLSNSGQLERGTPTLDRTANDLRGLVQKACADAEAIEGRKKISLQLELPDEPLPATIDAHWLTAALFELASNAIRQAQAQVRVCVRAIDNGVDISFSDDGKPCNPFDTRRFQTPGDRRGLGLGLALAHDVLRAHGGKLEVAHGVAAEGGVCVRIHLPRGV